MIRIQMEDIATVLKLAKTAKIDAGDASAVGPVLDRVELMLAMSKLPQQPPAAEGNIPGEDQPPATPAAPLPHRK